MKYRERETGEATENMCGNTQNIKVQGDRLKETRKTVDASGYTGCTDACMQILKYRERRTDTNDHTEMQGETKRTI